MTTTIKYALVLLAILCLPRVVHAQGWTKKLDFHVMETVTTTVATANGNVIAGSYLAPGDTVYHYFVAEVDTLGDVLWYHAEPTVKFATIKNAVVMSNGDIILVGNFQMAPAFWGDNGSRMFLAKYAATGTKLWEKEYYYPDNISWDNDVLLLPGDDLLVSGSLTNNNLQPRETEPVFYKLNSQGDSLTMVVLHDADTLSMAINKISIGHNNSIIAVGWDQISTANITYINLDQSLNVLWVKNQIIPNSLSIHPFDVIATSDGGYLSTGRDFYFNANVITHAYANKVDGNGDTLWHKRYHYQGGQSISERVLEPTPGKYVMLCNSASLINGNYNNPRYYRPFLLFTDSDGNTLRYKYYNGPTPFSTTAVHSIALQPDGGFFIGGTISEDNTYFEPNNLYDDDTYLIRTDSLGNIYYGAISGKLFADDNENCIVNGAEQSLPNWIITATGTDTLFTTTDSLGNYTLEVDSGTYQLRVLAPGTYWNNNLCPDSLVATVVATTDTLHRNIPLGKIVDCPDLKVVVEAPLLRYCLPGPAYKVTYCNNGTAQAANAIVEILLDNALVLDSASIAYVSLGGNRFQFNIGTIDIARCGSFSMHIRIDCGETLSGQAYCVEAIAFPDTVCMPVPLWDGARLRLETDCQPDSLVFRLVNTGSSMTDKRAFIIIQDDVLYANGDFELINGGQSIHKVPSNGSTWTLIAQQSLNYPGNRQLVKSIERCGINDQGSYSVGYLLHFNQMNASASGDNLCLVGVAAYDPNDKAAEPQGMFITGEIEGDQELTYRIRFQNTGTDTAFRVVVLDTLSASFNLMSIRQVNASHPMQWTILPGRVLQCTFYNILLPDSSANEAASHGFVSFTIDLKDSLPLGITIENTGHIYFDVNPPVVTNTTLHTIANHLKTWLTIVGISEPDSRVSFYPNPTQGSLNLNISGEVNGAIDFKVYDVVGKLIQEVRLPAGNSHQLQLMLESGTYIFEIQSGGERLGQGKLLAY